MVNVSTFPVRILALLLGVVVALATMFMTATSAQAKKPDDSPISQEISAPATNKAGETVGTFNGTLDISRFAVRGGELVAVGTVTGVVTESDGTTTKEVTKKVALPVLSGSAAGGETGTLQAQQECQILNLVLGPLDLNLLGLQVHLDQVVLDIVAVPGAGNLLGNLLCAVAGLLDPAPPNPLNLIADLLNQILGILQGL